MRLIRNVENEGFARANNQAMRVARGSWFLLLNSDTLLIDNSVACLFARIRTETGSGIAQCRLAMPDRRLQHSTYRLPSIKLAVLEDFGLYKLLPRAGETLLSGHREHNEERDVDWVAGSFMLLPRWVFDETGGFAETYFMYGEDMEWCYRTRDRGWHIRYYPDASVVRLDHSSAAMRWGEQRVAICVQREVDIYARRYGRLLGVLYNLVRMIGMLSRCGYFLVRNMAGGSQRDYYRAMKRYRLPRVRVHAALAVGWR